MNLKSIIIVGDKTQKATYHRILFIWYSEERNKETTSDFGELKVLRENWMQKGFGGNGNTRYLGGDAGYMTEDHWQNSQNCIPKEDKVYFM